MSTTFNQWAIKELTGYEPKTTFWQDFEIAEKFGLEAVEDTYKRAFEEWKTNAVFLTELVMVLNWKLWYWHDNHNFDFEMFYHKAYEEADDYAIDNLTGDDLMYFYRVTD